MALTPEAKKLLAETIRSLRSKLLLAIHDEADRRYRLSVPLREAGLDEAHGKRRERIEAWIDEHARAQKPKNAKELKVTKDRLLAQAEKEASATLINRLVLLRQLEAAGLSKPQVVTGGWNSKGYREFRDFAPALCTNGTTDATEGYATLLGLLFDELSVDLPGLYGDVGLTKLFAIPAATLREVIERLDDPELASAWTDDTTLGWVYQYWNDPDREALDAKINDGGKIAPHEIASKTQMFTERNMVEWLLQNSLGLTWLAMCKKHGWTADAERVLPVLDARRAEWRKKRVTDEVALDALMPIEVGLEDRWKYYVPQPIPEDAVQQAPECVRAIKLLDPACGNGHFLVIAFDLLAALYEEEVRHRGQKMTAPEIAESILDNNLHGIDIDPRAIQTAAAGLYLKCRTFAKEARPSTLNLVAPTLALGNLPSNDPAVVHLRDDLKQEVGIPEDLTNRLLAALAGVNYLGSLLKVDAAVEDALRSVELEFERARGQGDLFGGFPAQQVTLTLEAAKSTVLTKLERFLAKHSKSIDIGLRLDGEQLASGVRFVRIAKERTYDIVVGNPPYQGISKTEAFGYVVKTYPKGKSDLYAAFLERGLDLARPGGISVLLTMRAWMSIEQVRDLREYLLTGFEICSIGDFDRGAFDDVPNEVFAVSAVVFHRSRPRSGASVAIQPTPLSDRSYDRQRTARKRAAVLAQVGRYEFDATRLNAIEGRPLIYTWSADFLRWYGASAKIADDSPVREGMSTSDNSRFVAKVWEMRFVPAVRCEEPIPSGGIHGWCPTVMGAKAQRWMEPLQDVVRWHANGLEMKVLQEIKYGSVSRRIQSQDKYFVPDVAYSAIGQVFSARLHRYRSIFQSTGSSVFPRNRSLVVASLNRTASLEIISTLNPTVHFTQRDVGRLPLYSVNGADDIVRILEEAFSTHEAVREASIEFRKPGPTPWTYAQAWAQRAVDRSEEQPIPPYAPDYEQCSVEDLLSFQFGVAIGRFGASGCGELDDAASTSLSHGILFLAPDGHDSLHQAPCKDIQNEWNSHASLMEQGDADLSTYLRKSFFSAHRNRYENRPIYFPLSSSKRSFVAFVLIHRWQPDTLNILLADHLVPARRRLEGELDDLRTARASGQNKGKVERRFTEVQKLLDELRQFIANVTDIAENGPPPPDDKTTRREIDAKYVVDLDDGVMVNSAALWPLLEPQWKDPKKWWKELANAQGKKDYDWSHLTARYFPKRVRSKCHEDPSLAVAHKCFWELHPAKAYAWELRLQDEINPEFTIDEPSSDAARTKFLTEHRAEAARIRADEMKRRARKAANKAPKRRATKLCWTARKKPTRTRTTMYSRSNVEGAAPRGVGPIATHPSRQSLRRLTPRVVTQIARAITVRDSA